MLAMKADAQDWVGFHGSQHQGIFDDIAVTFDIPVPLHAKWRTEIPGRGFSSPVVLHDRTYLTTAYETNQGTAMRTGTFSASISLGFGLMGLIGVMVSRLIAVDWPKGSRMASGCWVFAVSGLVTTVLGICLVGESAFGLHSSVHRSWKVGIGIGFLGLCLMWLLHGDSKAARWLFATGAGILSLMAYWTMPRRDMFLHLDTSDAMISTSLVIGPALGGWLMVLGCMILAKYWQVPVRSPIRSSIASRFSRIAIWSGIPALIAVCLFWALKQRVLSQETAHGAGLLESPSGSLIFGSIACGLGIVFLSFFASQNPLRARWVSRGGAALALLLSVSSFVRFACLPMQRQLALAVACLDNKSGSIQWIREIAHTKNLQDIKVNSRATPTLAALKDGIYAYFGTGGLFGLDLDGKVKWRVEDVEFESAYGVGHSPVVADGILVLVNDTETSRNSSSGPTSVIGAYSTDEGRMLWQHQRLRAEGGSACYSTPIIRTIKDRRVVLVRGWEDLTSYDLLTGERQWTYTIKHRGNHLVAGIVTDGKRVYLMDAARVMALDLEALASGSDPLVWLVTLPGEKAASPVLTDGLLYVATETGVAACIDVETGDLAWKQKLGGRFFASIVAMGDVLIFASESGDVFSVARDRSYREIAKTSLGEAVYATPAPQKNGMIVRTLSHLIYFDGKPVH